ncbi:MULTISPECIES: methionine synthase [unclassified Planococcus (in: firmicutes)]|uniref:methionine synthase n=1 Tax=unclassified Planococcus (in: firmicutes) TaxID=2662419 RepID=UPI000C7D4E9B|nr:MULTISPECIES: methionine synthase [unclassified Planococcus (in: firmicutes)]PKG45509.1 methionine synthase [Planococcus sp. Urea-trap-24]PKG88894.1 methionine synthase [Planococcus sp. Urea-3u-39]PKH36262.1 methionine synthase [Planococcus sp. MB-3u-09]
MPKHLIEQQLEKRILIIDGAMGTMIQNADLSAEDFGGEEYDGCNEYLNIIRPDVLEGVHDAYLEAGADIICTNTFGGTPVVLDEYGLGHRAAEINKKAVEIAKISQAKYSTPEWPRFVAGALGPTTKTLSVTGGITFDELKTDFQVQAKALIEGGADLLLLETSQDMLNVKAATIAIRDAFEETGVELPVMISGTIEPMGTTLAGQTIEAFYVSIEHIKPLSVGLNCATGPEFMTDHLRSLSELSTGYVSCYPNAGLPDEEGHYHETPESLSKKLRGFAEKGWLNVVGGCCGTTPAHIAAVREAVDGLAPRERNETSHGHAVSGIEVLEYDDSMRPLFVGERTNVIGSRKFKRLIIEGKFEEAAEIARAQVKNGAHVIDICLANPDREELEDMAAFMQEVVKKVKVPLVIDSTDEDVIEASLKFSQGKAIINSINLEDGEERFDAVMPLVKKYGASVVVGTIDEVGMAVTRERKLEIAERSYQLLTEKWGLAPEDIIFDPLVFPVGTGDEQYIGSAVETVEGIRLIKAKLPRALTILGVSNVSFGLPPVGREVLNAVYLYHCTQAGLDYAIVNTEKLERFASIPKEEVKMAEELLFETTDKNLADFTDFYRDKKKEKTEDDIPDTVPERLAYYILEGTKEGLIPDLEKAREMYEDPLEIINGPLMEGMAEVGRLFNDNQLIVAEVLQSAGVMKAAVSYLEGFMEKKADDSGKGKVILATVKGDVHDIGKNLVDIILSNNGFKVIDIGIKVTPAALIEVIRKEQPDIVGLSGLLVKSAKQMVLTAQDFREADIDVPILVGGAALSRRFTETKIAAEYNGPVIYAKDAMQGLDLANRLQSGAGKAVLLEELGAQQEKRQAQDAARAEKGAVAILEKPVKTVREDAPVYVPNDLRRHVSKEYSVAHLYPYVNMRTLIGHHLGLRGYSDKLLQQGDTRAVELHELATKFLQSGLLKPAGMYQFFPAQSDGDDVIIYDPKDAKREIERFTFPRQAKAPFLCLADYLKSTASGEMDYVAFMQVTAGHGVRNEATRLKEAGRFLESHALQATALELAEGFAERMHQEIRDQWGFPDATDFSMRDRFAAKYQGQRFSFGYPACPNLEDQAKLFGLIKPEDIGVHLTEEFMMDPEASVSAIVFAHPDARYFNVE